MLPYEDEIRSVEQLSNKKGALSGKLRAKSEPDASGGGPEGTAPASRLLALIDYGQITPLK
jgi:hypothetical protein